MVPSSLIGALAVWAMMVRPIAGSHGDDLYAFSDCIYQCEQITCYNNHYYEFQWRFQHILQNEPDYEFMYYNGDWHFTPMPLPKHLQRLGWTCESNCDYQCQRLIHGLRKENKEELYQYHGKWPFLRIWGIQEFASAVLSVGNFIPHLLGFLKIRAALKSPDFNHQVKYAHYVVLSLSIVAMLAWTFSTIFHVRDYDITEKLDYYFAGLVVLTGFHYMASRLMGLLKPHKFWGRLIFASLCVAAYALHVRKLVTDWSYTYNMRANVAVGLLQNGCLYALVYQLYSKYYERETQKRPAVLHSKYASSSKTILSSFFLRSPKLYTLYPMLLSTIVVFGMSLELFDFPPFFYDLVDAHALWHLVTIFPAYYGWYDWMLWDINENIIETVDEKKNE